MAQRRWKPDRIIGVVTTFCTPGMRLLATLPGARKIAPIFVDYEVDAMLGLEWREKASAVA